MKTSRSRRGDRARFNANSRFNAHLAKAETEQPMRTRAIEWSTAGIDIREGEKIDEASFKQLIRRGGG